MSSKCYPTAVKIKDYNIRAAGIRGLILTLPSVWTHDLELTAGDRVEIYRDAEDRLILVPQKKAAS